MDSELSNDDPSWIELRHENYIYIFSYNILIWIYVINVGLID